MFSESDENRIRELIEDNTLSCIWDEQRIDRLETLLRQLSDLVADLRGENI